MADNPGSRDRSLDALDFIINVIKEHEQNLEQIDSKVGICYRENGRYQTIGCDHRKV